MKKFLLTLATVFVASFAMAQDATEYPVVTSVEELASYPDSTTVLFQDLEVVAVVTVTDYGYEMTTNCLADSTTQLGGDVPYSGLPSQFTAVGFVHTVENYDGTTYREFYVEEMVSVSKFNTLAELLNFGSSYSYYETMANSSTIRVKEGTATVSYVEGDNFFFYTALKQGYWTQYFYGMMNYPGAEEEFRVGDVLTGWFESGVSFKGTFTPTNIVYDDDWNEVSHKGSCFTMDTSEGGFLWSQDNVSVAWEPYEFSQFADGYCYEGGLYRLAPGLKVIEQDGKYYLEGTYTYEDYVEKEDGSWGWVDIEATDSIETASNYVDLSQYVGATLDKYVAGVWDYCNLGETDRFLICEFIDTEVEHQNIAEYLAKGEQDEYEILTKFANPMKVTYVYNDDSYKFVIMVEDESGALALDFASAICHADDYTPPTEERLAAYEALKAIKPGDMISGVKGLAQYVVANTAPKLVCSVEEWDSSIGTYGGYVYTTYVPTVESSGAEIKPTMTVSVGDLLNEWNDCMNNSTMPKIANKVVSIIDAQVVDTIDQYNSAVKYLIQGTDTMELSNLWGEKMMNFQVFERNNIVGIADFYTINSNGIYQIMPLSQEHITDATLIPEVESIEELADYAGLPVILKNAQIITGENPYMGVEYFLQDAKTYVHGLQACGKFDLKGIYEVDEYAAAFTVLGVEQVHSFTTISDMDNYTNAFPEAAGQAYNVDGEAIVTYIDGENVFVQYEGTNSWGMPMTVGNVFLGLNVDVKVGDAIVGIKGISTPKDAGYDENWDPYFNCGAYFTMAEDANVTIASSDNEVTYDAAQYVNYIVGYNEGNYSGLAMKLFGGGKILKENDKYYYEETLIDKYGGEPAITRIEVASNMIDLETYVDQTISTEQLVLGVYNVGNTTPDARIFYITGFMSTILEYQNIAEFYAAGEIEDTAMVSRFTNPLTVTYVHIGEYSYYLFVQDETGGLRIEFQSQESVANYKIGDQISGVHGSSMYSWMGMLYLAGYDQNSWTDYTDYTVSGTADPIAVEVTIPALNEEGDNAINNGITATTYVSNLVELKNVSLSTVSIEDIWGDVEEFPCFVDEQGNQLLLPRGYNGFDTRGFTTYEKMNVVGIIDFAGINYNQLYTIYPRTQDDIKDVTGIEGVEVNGGIYVDAANQVVANGAVAVVVYDLNGRTVATANAATVSIDALAQGVYVVRATYADGAVATAKVVR